MISVLMEFSMFPVDKGESVGEYVSRIAAMIGNSGVTYQLTPMGTILETDDLGKALAIVDKAYQLLESDCNRVYATLKLDIRRGRQGRIESKVSSVEHRIGSVKQ